ncbi:amidohydrolase family protein [Ramlibacter terrae]|uniref:Amidohydrolase family protein n=1 Tax=Ramlibacter terrae TaxID=2732511 RepID=A0ABX6P4J6_9BURK|nr:amidohydrolase family protein [Ramlibacter terrae]
MNPAVPGQWDCHAHLFGPYERFPLAPERSYTPPEAIEPQYMALLRRLGLGHGVLVHPSAYGDDHSLLLHALAVQPALRGVVVVRPGSPLPLKGLREQGVRGARFSHRSGAANFAGSASIADLQVLAPQLADAGLHAELWTDCQALPGIAAQLRELPVPVVIDHMGGFDVKAGVDDPGFRTLLGLLESGNVWVKLCAYRNLLAQADWEAGRPFQQAMVAANPQRLVWGSDWPHLRVTPVPDTVQLLDMFMDWAGSDNVVRQVLGENAERLYR